MLRLFTAIALLVGAGLAGAQEPLGYTDARAKAVSAKTFLVTWVGDKPKASIAGAVTTHADHFNGFKSGDVIISGPWPGYEHVFYTKLSNPSVEQVQSALAAAKGASSSATPFDQQAKSSADSQAKLPVGSTEALAEVNALRAARGLRPYIFDAGLTEAAAKCALFRAARFIDGHTHDDFSFRPSGCWADAAGCAAWPPALGWGSCCIYENFRFGGAAFAVGKDGKRYMHLFVRH